MKLLFGGVIVYLLWQSGILASLLQGVHSSQAVASPSSGSNLFSMPWTSSMVGPLNGTQTALPGLPSMSSPVPVRSNVVQVPTIGFKIW